MVIDAMPEALGWRFAPPMKGGSFPATRNSNGPQAIYIRTMAFCLLANESKANVLEKCHKPVGEQREVPMD